MEQFHFFWRGEFSQWHKSNFMYNSQSYNTCEQFMMAHKAILFKDNETYELIVNYPSAEDGWA